MKKKLCALEILRIYACVLVYRWHVGKVNLDNRPLLIFFVLSGFVIAYQYYRREERLSWKSPLQFAYKRLAKFYPAHIVVVLALIPLKVWYQLHGMSELGTGTAAEFAKKLLLSATLTQSWASDPAYHYCMNGVAWFISALLFYYLLTPFLLEGLRKLKNELLFFVAAVLCSVLYAQIPGWMGEAYYSTSPLLYLPLYVEGLALGAMYALLLCRSGFVQIKKTRAVVAVLFVVFYMWQTYAPAQLRLPWLLPFGGDDMLIWLLIFGLAQELWPLKLLGNRVVQFCASRVMTVYLVHQAWFMYVDELRDGLARRQIYSITSGQRAVIRLIGTLVLAELLHSVLPRVLEACKTKVQTCMQKRKEPADGGKTECTQKS